MPYLDYPTALDLSAMLVTAGFTEQLAGCLDLETAIAAGIRIFEERTGRRFIAVTQTRTFDLPYSPRGVIDLHDDLASASAVSVAGVAQTAGSGYRLLPVNAVHKGRPYAQLQLPRAYYNTATWGGAWGQVSVTGLWGWPGGIPEDVWQAMLMMAALVLFPQIVQRIAGGLESWSEMDMTERYGSDPLGSLRTNWRGFLFGPEGTSGGEGMGGLVGIWRRVTVG